MMVNRLKNVLDKMLSENQKGFVKGSHILDIVITTHELEHSVEHNKKPSMAFELDIYKAYDRVSWHFLFDVLRKFCLKGKFLKIIV